MIPIDDDHPPSDPSSSHHHKERHITHDLEVSDINLKSSDAADLDDTCIPLPNICIRDYVFGLRNKDVACNWPFSSTSLQLCLKHGVNNLLPPFQSLESPRNNTPLTRCTLENRLTDDELIKSFQRKPMDTQFKSSVRLTSVGSKDKISRFHLQEHLPHTKSMEKPFQKIEKASPRIKKTRVIMKLNPTVERVEEVTPNSFIASETIASKVCPVCKIFSSSSNTTLNAHIDQCLTREGTMKWTDNTKVIVKHKVKPRKMRLMVDVYKAALDCTVEELDKRNGTSWAANSSFPAQEFEFQGDDKEEEEEAITTKINPESADNEGDVYIDTKGKKVRILSIPKAGSSDNHGARKSLKVVKGSEIVTPKKKNNIFKKKHHHKYLKLSPNVGKLSAPTPQAIRSGGQICRENEQVREIMEVADLGIARLPLPCSKRADLSKTFSYKHQKMENLSGKNSKAKLQCRETKDLLVESDKSSSGCDLGTPRSSSNYATSSQSRKKMRTPLMKQPLNFRKEDLRLHDDGDDGNDDDDDDVSRDACPSQHSDGDDARSKGSKFSSLCENLSFPAPKFNLKRKFSGFKKLNEKSVNGPSQNSSRDQSADSATRSNTSKSSNEEFSMGVNQTISTDELHDVESVRNETLISNVDDQVRGIPAPSFISLSTSFDPEISKCIDIYQDQICSTNRAPNDVEQTENYFREVDPIPIPGPPGSFLPASPGGEMVSEDQQSGSPVSTVSNSRSTSAQDDTFRKPTFVSDMGFTEKGTSHNSFKNDQPCCCSRKEAAFNYQDSFTSRRLPIDSNRSIPSGLNFKSDMFSAATSPSKPVLRLMGKNLTVDKTDEYEDVAVSSQQFKPPQSSQQDPQRPVIFSQYQHGFDSQHFNVHPSIVHGGFMESVDRYGSGGYYMGPMMPQARPHHGHNIPNFQAVSGRNLYNAAARSQPEIIVIDDSLENEADDSIRNKFVMRNQVQIMNPLYSMYPSQRSKKPFNNGGGNGGPSVFRGDSFQTLGNGDFGKWNIGSSSQSSSMSHVPSSTTYYPPSYP